MPTTGLREDRSAGHRTLVEMLEAHAEAIPERGYEFLSDGELGGATRMTFAELHRRARTVAAELIEQGATGERVLLLFPPGLEFIVGLFGCMYARALAVPAYPPRPNRVDPRLRSIAADCRPRAVLTLSSILERSASTDAADVSALAQTRWIALDQLGERPASDSLPTPDPSEPAFLQYTSGSTRMPRGVMVTHANLVHNEEMIRCAFGQNESSVVVGWLPMYHDMGLIGNVLQPLWVGCECVLMPPVAFLQKPLRWLAAIDHYRGTTSGGPNFAYDHCVRKIAPEQRRELDLSSWSVAFNGAEPVRADTLERFAEAFADSGFQRRAFYPCYGLAEATLFVTGGEPGTGARAVELDASSLERHRAVTASPGEGARSLVACGTEWSDQRVLVVDPEARRPVAPGRVGEIWVAGRSVADGYWGEPEESELTFRARLASGEGPFLRTGDLGFRHDGELFVAGRLKDLIILRGRNHYPHDLELTAEASDDALRPGCSAAFAVDDGREERLVLVCELDRRAEDRAEPAIQAVIRAVAEQHEVRVHEVVLVRMGTVPKTSSGKIRRSACRSAYLAGELAALARDGAEAGPADAVPSASAAVTLDRDDLLALPESERSVRLLSWLRAEVARLVEVAPERVDPERALTGLGLDSLAAVELQHAAESGLGVEISLTELLEGATVARLARTLTTRLAEEPVLPVPTGDRSSGERRLSIGQRGIWFLHRLAPSGGAYNLVLVGRTGDPLDPAALRRALEALGARHSCLRSTFHETGSEPVRRVAERVELDFEQLEASSWSEDVLERHVAQESWRPFDLSARQPMRVRIWERRSGERVVLLALHHIIADFWSLAVMLDELGTLYTAETEAAQAELPELPASYDDFVRRQRERLAGREGERLWEYWRERLGGDLPVLDLPTDRPRPAVQSFRGGSRAAFLAADLVEELERTSRERGATLFTTLLAAFHLLLHRHSGQSTTLVGAPTAGRDRADLAGLVGYFTNPVVLRADLSPDGSFADLLAAVRRDVLGAFDHAAFPFPLLTERLHPQRDASRNPIFQAMLVLQGDRPSAPGLASFGLGEAGARVRLGELSLASVRQTERRSPFDVMLMLAETDGGLAASLQYASDLFDASTVARWLGHYETLLRQVVAEPERSLSEIGLLTPAERQQTLWAWNDTALALDRELRLTDRFVAQAERAPDAPAVIDCDRVLTYGVLIDRVDRLARRLAALGVGPEVRVGVCLERGADLVVSLLAVLRAGGAYVPLDPSYPTERLRFMLEDAAAPVVVGRPELLAGVVGEGVDPVSVDPTAPGDGAVARLSPRSVAPENLAYLIYTSGSTGRPKAVAIEHRRAVAMVAWAMTRFGPEDLACVAATTSVCFDLSVFELFVPLSAGGSLFLSADAPALAGSAAASRVTLINTVPSAMERLVDDPLPGALRVVNLAGEALPGDLVDRIHRHALGVRVHNLYGPSEDTTYSTGAAIAAGDPAPSIGRPLANTRAYVRDPEGRPAPVGVPGELWLGGEGLARGYLGRPGLTAERFLPDGLSGRSGERLYRTGDLVRWRPDGELEFLGRIDHQVKIHGFRIELGEVEAALRVHPGIDECVVVARAHPESGRRLVAYVAGDLPVRGATGELQRFLRERLPAHMVPPVMVVLDALPRTPNGKVDRKALPEPEAARFALGTDYAAPEGERERALCAIWARVLGVERIGLHDNFFELGGDSILSLEVVRRARMAGLRLVPQQLFQHQTVAELAAVTGDDATASERAEIVGPVPLTPIQRWFFGLGLEQPEHFDQAVWLEARSGLDRRTLDAALDRLICAHDALRFRFTREADGSWHQEATPWRSGRRLAVVDLDAITPARREAAATAAAAVVQSGFDLSRGPLFRSVLFAAGGAPDRLLLSAHHLVIDGVSWRILLEDLQSAYGALGRGVAAELPAPATPLPDWVEQLERHAAGPGAEEAPGWERVAAAEAPPLPAALRPGADRPAGEARNVTVELAADDTLVLLQDLPRAWGGGVEEALLAALVGAFAGRTGERRLRLDREGHGREPLGPETDLSRTVGWLTALHPLLLDLGEAEEPEAAVRAVREQLDALPGHGATWGLHLEAGRVSERVRSGLVVNYLGRLDGLFDGASAFAAATLPELPLQGPRNRRPHALAVNAWVLGGRLTVRWEHAAGEVGEEAVRELAEDISERLREIAEACSAAAGTVAEALAAQTDTEEAYPVSPLQAGFLMHALASPGSGAYIQQLSSELAGDVDENALFDAWRRLTERHSILRTRFVGLGLDEPLQAVEPEVSIPVARVDWSDLPAAERERCLESYLEDDRARGFDLGRAPLLRLLLARTGAASHRLVVTYHHLLLDGWSLVLLIEELFSLYAASRAPGGVPEARAAAPFREYIDWLRSRDPEPGAAFWRRTVGDFDEPTPLAADRPVPPPDESFRHGEVALRLPAGTTAALAGAARGRRLTQGTLVQAAWALLLARLSGRRDVVFGTVTSGRSADLPEMERRIGLFIHTVPLRLDADPRTGLGPWLREVQARAAAAQQHEHTPLVEIQAASGVIRGRRMFDSVLAFENYPIDEALRHRAGGLEVSDVRFVERTDYPMAVVVTPGERMSLQIIYDRRRFDPTTARRRLGHLRALLEAAVERPDGALGDLPWLSHGERHQLVREWNDTRAPVRSAGRLVHELFDERAERAPDAVAVVHRDAVVSYGELARRAHRLGRRLRALGVGRGSMVAVHLGRSVETVVAVLGILAAGGTYVPIEVSWPPRRLRWIAEFLDLRWVVTEAQRVPAVEKALDGLGTPAASVAIDAPRAGELDAGGPTDGPLSPVAAPDDLAYVIFTSGSTGTPKGVAVQHAPVVNLIEWVNEFQRIGPDDRVLFITSLSFDLSVYDVFGILAAGGSIQLAAEEQVREPRELVRLMVERPVTFWDSAPAALQQLIPFLPRTPATASALRLVFLSGDWVPLGIRDDVRAAFPHAEVVALGGATEATIWSNHHRIETVRPSWRSIPYGRPIRNARYHVLDPALEPLPIGVAGDLFIGGPCLAWGYAGSPRLTAEKFVPDPFAREPGAVLYRTGDRARHHPDGEIEFLGRLDHQIKIRGFRIELGEIESVLGEHPALREVLVLVREDTPGDRRLVAYAVLRDDCSAGAAELRDWLSARLPSYMVPSAFVLLDAMPVTPNGKVDRKALPAPEAADAAGGEGERREATPLEDLIATQWAQVLPIPDGEAIGLDRSFFDLGGQSLLAARLVGRLREVLGTDLTLQDLFEAPTIAGFAERIETRLAVGREDSVALERIPRDGALPASFGQQRLWFLDRLDPGRATYNIAAAVRLDGALDPGALSGALTIVVARHEALRTTFRATEEGCVQVVEDRLGGPQVTVVPRIDLGSLSGAMRDREERRLAAAEATRPFDLETGPLFRVTLVRTAEDRHLALVTLHHIIADGASVEVLLRELAVLYPALRQGAPAPVDLLPELPVQLADFAAWQTRHLERTEPERMEWWRRRLAGAPHVLELPTDRPRPSTQAFAGASRRIELPAELTRAVESFSAAAGATPFMTLLAAFAALLGRYGGGEDLLIGTPAANRERPEVEPLIGFFVNTLALRAKPVGSAGFRQLLAEVRETALGAWAHQDLPFERIVEELQPERSLAHHPLFQVMFTYERDPERLFDLPGLTLEILPPEGGVTKFDLAFSVIESRGRLRVVADYRTDLFDATTVERWLGAYERLLTGALAEPDRPLARFDSMAPAQRHQLLVEWGGSRPVPALPLAHRAVEETAERSPEAVALVCADGSLTYGELDARANRLARRVRRVAGGPGVRVGVALGRSSRLPIALLAIWKAGGVYVPLDPGHPPARLRFVAEDAGVEVLLTEERWAGQLAELTGARTILLDAETTEIAAERPEPPADGSSADALAYLIYTSGSTGRPKGVPVEHRSLAGLLAACRAELDWTGDDVMPCIAPYSFDIFLFELLNPLAAGGTSVLLETRPTLELDDLLATLPRATRLHAVPALMRQVVDAAGYRSSAGLRSLRTVFVGGDRVPPDLLPDMAAAFPAAEVRVLYGPTEATVICASHRVGASDAGSASAWIGRPLPGASLRVCNESGTPVPLGAPGEIWIGGSGVSRGYWQRDDLTGARFVEVDGRRWYKSGDLARHLRDGSLEFLGRTDRQVKVRGFRIDPGEIESVLREHDAVTDAVVLSSADGIDQRLVAWVVAADGAAPDNAGECAEDLRAWLGEQLPAYMIPAAVGYLPEIPLTPHGKVDRAALPAPELSRRAARTAPRTPLEREVAAIWSEVLEVPDIGLEDGFFDLGGHSLLANRIVSRVRTRLDVELPLRTLFEASTLESFVGAVASARQAAGPSLPLRRMEWSDSRPISFAQSRLWYLDRLDPGDPTYNMPLPLRLSGELEPAVLAAALSASVDRHDVLRARFEDDPDGARQVICPTGLPTPLPVIDLRALPQARRRAEAESLAALEAALPFDLRRGPLVRFTLLRLGTDEHRLLTTLHHVVGDGWSMEVLVREIGRFYRARIEGRPVEPPAPALRYADWAAWQREWLESGGADDQLEWWRRYLEDAPAPELSTDRDRRAAGRRPGGFISRHLAPETAAGVRRLARDGGASLYMAALAGFSALLGRYGDREEVVVGTPLANRQRPEVEGVVGFFVNTLPVRSDLSGDPSFSELLSRVRAEVLAVQAHQDVPFETLVRELRPGHQGDDAPFFRTVLSVERSPLQGLALPGVEVEHAPVHNATAKFDLTLTLIEDGDRLTAWLEHGTDTVDRTRAERLLGHWERLLASAAEAPERHLSEHAWLTRAERHQALVEWNDTVTAYPADRRVDEIFSAQAAATPDAVAATFGRGALTYRELDRRSNDLAWHLAGRGIGRGVRVGVVTERSLEMLVALLAIAKAGGAYVPLDPTFPDERLELMVADSAIELVLAPPGLTDAAPEQTAVLAIEPGAPVATEGTGAPQTGAGSDDPVYVIYTSGSTGRPKGVSVPHRGVVRLVKETDYVRLGPEETVLQMAPLSFDASTFEIWGALLTGGCVAVMPPGETSLADLERELTHRRVTTFWLTAGLFHLAVEEVPGAFRGVRQLLAGGDALSVPHVERALEALPPGARLIDGYGPTEGTVFTCCHPMSAGLELGGSVPIGRPIANTGVTILDRRLEPVAIGVPAELCIGGDGLAHGYQERPGLTAERFVPHPWPRVPGERLYRTGDLTRLLHDGRIEFLGRFDDQLKIRGFRVEPGEVEALLAGHEAVREVTVVARRDPGGDPRLVAYLVLPDPDALPAVCELARDSLPGYMIPDAWMVLERLPLTPNGKIDRRALPDPKPADPGRPEGHAPGAGSPVAEIVAGLWGEVLDLERVDPGADFYASGGHSLLATLMVSRVRATFGVEVSLRALLEAPTLDGFTRAVERAVEEDRQVAELPPITPIPDGEVAPLSAAQRRLWYLDRVEPGNSAYNIPAGMRIRGDLDLGVLARSLDEIVRRHEVLRSSYPERAGVPMQRIAPAVSVPLPAADLSALVPDRREAVASGLLDEEIRRPFDLARGPLLRALLLRFGADDHLVVFTLHHIVSDGWSMEILVRELGALYEAFAAGRPSPLPELPFQYPDFAAWQRSWLEEEIQSRQLPYWLARLAGAPEEISLPTARRRHGGRFASGLATTVLGESLYDDLRGLARERRATLFMVLLAGWKALLHLVSGEDDVSVGAPIANRHRREVEELIGFFVNTIVLRTDLEGNPSFLVLLERVRERTLEAHAHQDLSFDRLVDELDPPRVPGRNPFFQILFDMLSFRGAEADLAGLDVEILPLVEQSAKFDMTLYVAERSDSIELRLAFNADLFDLAVMDGLLADYRALLERAVREPEARLSSLLRPLEDQEAHLVEAFSDSFDDMQEV